MSTYPQFMISLFLMFGSVLAFEYTITEPVARNATGAMFNASTRLQALMTTNPILVFNVQNLIVSEITAGRVEGTTYSADSLVFAFSAIDMEMKLGRLFTWHTTEYETSPYVPVVGRVVRVAIIEQVGVFASAISGVDGIFVNRVNQVVARLIERSYTTK